MLDFSQRRLVGGRGSGNWNQRHVPSARRQHGLEKAPAQSGLVWSTPQFTIFTYAHAKKTRYSLNYVDENIITYIDNIVGPHISIFDIHELSSS